MIKEIMWNEVVDDIRKSLLPSSVIWIHPDTPMPDRGPNHFPPNALLTSYIRLGTISEYRERMEEAIVSNESLQQWLTENTTLLVVVRVDGDHIVDYAFHANSLIVGQHLHHPLTS